MNTGLHHRSFSLYLTATALIAASAAHASDDRLWREQIPRVASAPVTLAPAPHAVPASAADWLWREQVAPSDATLVFVARGIDRDGPPDYALWREQVQGVDKPVDAPTHIVTESRDQ